jgi:hypothetical protein
MDWGQIFTLDKWSEKGRKGRVGKWSRIQGDPWLDVELSVAVGEMSLAEIAKGAKGGRFTADRGAKLAENGVRQD